MTYDSPEPRAVDRDDTAPRSAAPSPSSALYDEWLLDEAVEQTFPASDPPATTYPGSSVARREEAHAARRAASVRRVAVAATVFAGVLACVWLQRRRGRGRRATVG